MAELHVIAALRDKRSELAGMVTGLERQLAEHRASLTHVDATMRLFDPQLRPEDIRPRQQRTRSAWFRPGECLRLIYDAPEPATTRELAARIMAMKSIVFSDDRQRELIERIKTAGVVRWRVRQAARARCQ